MKKLLVSAIAAMAAMASFGWGDTDKDPEGVAYNDTSKYNVLKANDGGGDKSFNNITAEYWDGSLGADGLYIALNGKGCNAQYTSAGTLTFGGKTLIISSWTTFHVYGSANSWIEVNDLRLRPLSTINNWWINAPVNLKGNLTLIDEGTADDWKKYAPRILVGKTGSDFNVAMNIAGVEKTRLHIQRYYQASSYEHDKPSQICKLTGDNSEFLGTLQVGSDLKMLFGKDSAANAKVVVNGENRNAASAYLIDTSIAQTSIGVTGNDGVMVKVKTLEFADGATIDCASILENKAGFEIVDALTLGGKVNLDFTGAFFAGATSAVVLSSPTALSLDSFNVIGLPEGMTLDLGDEGKSIVFNNPNGKDFVKLIADESSNPGSDAIEDWAFFGGEHWSDGNRPNAETDYLVPGGMTLRLPYSWKLIANAGTDGGKGNNIFLGKSLTVADGAKLSMHSGPVGWSDTYCYRISDLILEMGSLIYNSTGNCSSFASTTKMTVNGTSEKPVSIKVHDWNHATNYSGLYFDNAFVGDSTSCLQILGDAATEPTGRVVSFRGDNSGFYGTLLFGAMASKLHADFGGVGFPNGAVVFNSAVRMGTYKGTGALVSFKSLTLADETILDAHTMVTNNAGYGFKVTDSFVQKGAITIDLGGVATTKDKLPILSVKATAGDIDLSKCALINADASYSLDIVTSGDYKILAVINPAGASSTTFTPNANIRLTAVASSSAGEDIDPANWTVSGGNAQAVRFFAKDGVLYAENMACQVKTEYDAYMTQSDYRGKARWEPGSTTATESFRFGPDTENGHWSTGTAPEAGKSYFVPEWITCHLNTAGTYEFAGDSLTIGPASKPSIETMIRVDPKCDITGDFRFMKNSRFFSAGNSRSGYPVIDSSTPNSIIRGELRVFSNPTEPMFIRYNADGKAGSYRYVQIYSHLTGFDDAAIEITTVNASAENLSTTVVDFLGDTSDYTGKIIAPIQSMVRLGDAGLVKGEVDLTTDSSILGVVADKTITVDRLSLAANSVIKYYTAAGIMVNKITKPAGGKFIIDLANAQLNEGSNTLLAYADYNGSFSASEYEIINMPKGATVTSQDGMPVIMVKYSKEDGLSYATAFKSIEAYNAAITSGEFNGKDIYLVLDGKQFFEGTDYSLAGQATPSVAPETAQARPHIFFLNCQFEGGSCGKMSPDKGPGGEAVNSSNRKEIALCIVKELVVSGCSFAPYTGDSYVIDVNVFNWFDNDGCGITIENNDFAAGAGNRAPISVKNKYATPPAFVIIKNNRFYGNSSYGYEETDKTPVICFADQSGSTTTFGGANFPITITTDNTYACDEYAVLSGVFIEKGKEVVFVDKTEEFTWSYDEEGKFWTSSPVKFPSDPSAVVPTLVLSGGTGAENDPYLVSKAEDFAELDAWLDKGNSTEGMYFKQTAEITLTGCEGIGLNNAGNQSTNPFLGVYDGDNKTINVTFSTDQSLKYTGIFNTTGAATIKNLTVAVNNGGEPACKGIAALIGYANGTTVKNVTVNGAINGTHNCAGLIVKAENCVIEGCVNNANVTTSYNKAGGLVAFTSEGIQFKDCVNKGNITSTLATAPASDEHGVGGIIGWSSVTMTIENCSNTGTIAWEGAEAVGSIIGGYGKLKSDPEITLTIVGWDGVAKVWGRKFNEKAVITNGEVVPTQPDPATSVAPAAMDMSGIGEGKISLTVADDTYFVWKKATLSKEEPWELVGKFIGTEIEVPVDASAESGFIMITK